MRILLLWLLAAPALAQTALWEVSNGRHQVLVGGTVHLLSPADFPLPAPFEQAFRMADKVYFETDIGELSKPEFARRVTLAMMYRDGTTLRSVLAPDVWQQLERFMAERNLPVISLLLFKPGFAGISLTLLEAQRLGLGQGVDHHYYQRARQTGKAVGFLETPAQQLALLDQLNQLEPNSLLRSTLAELDKLPEILQQVVAAWRSGNMEELDRLMGREMRAQSPALYDTLLVARNRAWLPQIEAMLETPELETVLVGAMHLAGPDNLLQLLRERGYQVRRYQ